MVINISIILLEIEFKLNCIYVVDIFENKVFWNFINKSYRLDLGMNIG